MYSLILMMAMNTTGAELPAFGRSFSCDGGCFSCAGCFGCDGGHWRRGRLFNLGHGCDGGCHGCDGGCDGGCFGCDGGCFGCHGGFFRGLLGRLHGCDGGCFGCNGCFGGEVIHVPSTPTTTEPPKSMDPKEAEKGKAAAMTSPAKATLVVNVPANTKVMIDGEATGNGSGARVFSTPVLQPGFSYRYIIQAEMLQNGQTVVQSKAVTVKAGEESRISFDQPAIAMPMPRGETITRTSNVMR